MSGNSSSPVSLQRYHPVLYILTGVATACALYYVHSNFVASSQPPSQASLRRRNAVRRHRRTNEFDEPEIANTPAFRAINHLTELERNNGVYGTFRIETEDGSRVECGLLPSLLATRRHLMAEMEMSSNQADRIRQMMEATFLESFLALDFPPSHTIPEGTAERDYLIDELHRRGISRTGIVRALDLFNANDNYGEEVRRRRQNGERVQLATDNGRDFPPPVQRLDAGETTVDDQSVFSWRDGNNDMSPSSEGQNLLNLLYHIADDQARRDGYIHRGVTCNSCGAMPIQGIRYRCANCIDYDLCETCEAMQVHIKTHLFYKVRIPAPFLGNPRQSQPVWYPGKPMMLPRSLPRPLAKRLMKETNFENTELDALWDQFRCLANSEWPSDPNKLGMAIDRKTFDRCFVPNTSIRPPPPSLIYDRMFAFYDTNGDNLIGFEEFLKGLASLNNKSADERIRRIFRGSDIDGDGYVERKDFLRMFRAYYTLSRELTRDMVAGLEDDFLEGGARDVILGSQPISSAFPGSFPTGEASRSGEGKRTNLDGDMEIIDNEGVLRPDGMDSGDRNAIVGDAAVRDQFGRVVPVFPSTLRLSSTTPAQQSSMRPMAGNYESDGENHDNHDDDDDDSSSSSVVREQWPPVEQILDEDIVNALGAFVPLEEVMDQVDRARIGAAVFHRMQDEDRRRLEDTYSQGIQERWQRRRFYIDEEDGATAPEGYQESPDLYEFSDDEEAVEELPVQLESHPPSPRSRSSSKVRFQDDVADDYDVRSNPSTSSRSIPVGERWGGFEVPEVEKDAGKEILYQVTQQGINELLDLLFKSKEDLLMEAYHTRAERKRWAREIELVEQMDPKKRSNKNEERTNGEGNGQNKGNGGPYTLERRTAEESIQAAGHPVSPQTAEVVRPEPALVSTAMSDVLATEENNPGLSDLAEPLQGDPDVLGGPRVRPPTPTEPFLSPPSSPYIHAVDDGSLPTSASLPFDPTLPQHRPSESETSPRHPQLSFHDELTYISTQGNAEIVDMPSPSSSGTRSHSQQSLRLRFQADGSTSFPAPLSPDAEATAPKFPPSPQQPLPPLQGSPTVRPQRSPPQTPSPQELIRWALLNQAEHEAKERGGGGAKLNFEEFQQKMNADKSRRLGFVGTWIEMASF
jgi:hypothetical protein